MLKKLKSIFALAMVVTMTAALLFSSCGSRTATQTLTLGIWKGNDQETASLNQVLANIMLKNNISVGTKIYTNYETELKADIAAGTAPDVFYVDSSIAPEIIKSGAVASLDDITGADKANASDFYPNLLAAFTSDSKLYGFPKDYSALGVFYDATLLDKAGYKPTDIPKALEDWPAFLTALQAKLPSGVVALSINQELARTMSFIQTTGSNVYKTDGTCNLDDPNVVKAVQFLGDLFKGGNVKTAAELGDGWVGDTLGHEKAAIVIEGNWMIGYLNTTYSKVKYGTLEMPTYNGKPNTMSFTVAYAVNAKSNNLAAAKNLAMYLTNPENQKTWCTGAGVLPSRQSVATTMKLADDKIEGNLVKGGAYSTPWQAGLTLSIIAREFNNWFPKVCTGEMTAQDAMKQAVQAAAPDIQNILQ
ncbi:MAG: extracellular solute-binding protein [Oscillospiraceae bacterium]|nr:extracellular solute-binding protein [Oscillospiraceae bacterium]